MQDGELNSDEGSPEETNSPASNTDARHGYEMDSSVRENDTGVEDKSRKAETDGNSVIQINSYLKNNTSLGNIGSGKCSYIQFTWKLCIVLYIVLGTLYCVLVCYRNATCLMCVCESACVCVCVVIVHAP